MKYYLKIFLISIAVFAVLFFGAWKFFIKEAKVDESAVAKPEIGNVKVTLPGEKEETNKEEATEEKKENVTEEKKKMEENKESPLDILVKESDRVNFLVFAHDGERADTIMFVSFDPSDKLLDIISIPRDTYWLVEGYTKRADHKKINAVYGHRGEKGGSKGLKQEIANMLKVPVHYYVKFNYNGVAAVVDTLGGINVNIPFKMDYDDVWVEPKLHIHFEKGPKLLSGQDAVKYLRWRQNNNDAHSAGDLPRISRTQDFIKKAIRKSLSLKLPSVVSTGIKYVKTDIKANLAISYADDAATMSMKNISTYKLPGDAPPRSRYYIGDPSRIEKLLIEIYSKGQND